MSHGLDAELIRLQSEAMEIPIIQWETSWKTYGQQLKEAFREMKKNGINGVVFGDIHEIPGHEGWVDQVCIELGLASIKPLWGLEPRKVLASFLAKGFKATLVMVKAEILGEEWLGREIDEDFENDLSKLKRNINLTGELGEYHTFVTDGPIFKKRIKILESGKKLKNGFWYLDITRSELRKKGDNPK
jgi:uncharacterized protein (TIGR00290 family)